MVKTLSGTGLVIGTNALILPTAAPDIAAYNGRRDLQGNVYDKSQWITQDGSGNQSNDGIAPDVPFDSSPFILINAIADEKYDQKAFSIFPIPLKDENLSFSKMASGDIYDENGMCVKSFTNVTSLDISNLKNGCYIIKTGAFNTKLLIQ